MTIVRENSLQQMQTFINLLLLILMKYDDLVVGLKEKMGAIQNRF